VKGARCQIEKGRGRSSLRRNTEKDLQETRKRGVGCEGRKARISFEVGEGSDKWNKASAEGGDCSQKKKTTDTGKAKRKGGMLKVVKGQQVGKKGTEKPVKGIS